MNRFVLIRLAVATAAVLSLGACALLSSPKPVQTYRFGAAAGAAIDHPAGAGVKQVSLREVEFPEAVEGDRILGVTGTQTAYIKGARWVSRAQDLYMDSLESAFATQATRVRVIRPRELTRGDTSLDIDIRAFEARYSDGGGAPVVTIVARARLLALPGRTVAAEQTFTVEQPAAENRVSAIVAAFDIAARDLNSQIVGWTDQNAG